MDSTLRCTLRLTHQGRHRMGAKSGVYDCTVPDCASAGTSLSIVLCLSVSVSVTSRCSIETDERFWLVIGMGAYFGLSCIVI